MSNELVVSYKLDNNDITLTPDVVQNYMVQGGGDITVQEFKLFAELCKAQKLNPFIKEAYCIKYGKKTAQCVVGKDAIHKRAIKHPDYDGIESGIIVCDNNSGVITERQGGFYMVGQEQVVGGWARVYRKNWSHPKYESVAFGEVAQSKSEGGLNSMWSSKGAMMVEKVAKVRALRESFIEELGGMYEAEEFGFKLDEPINQEEPIIVQEEPTIVQDEPSDVVDIPFEDVPEAQVVSFADL